MRLRRKGFTLIELLIAISILSIMMLFLYKSYAALNDSNRVLKRELSSITNIQNIKKIIYLDFSLALFNTTKIDNRDKKEDFVFLQSSHSIHKRYNPYVTYIVKEKKLYRLESLKKISTYELPAESEFDIDYLGEVNSFRLYKSLDKTKEFYLVHIDFKRMENLLMKIKVLNEE
ncbi:MAG: type II secretion system protein [Epsilonproteobacteria bacterium]|nr:type II secretion system protein [Campylobacterota bacterium]OIO13597.1 MAG: hypothetical protein AUJ81_11055 [Helicobacteraceae bacterium CG1_02_36_14]PIP10785.1 MAG: hypothetical protein COX50_04100 [Sulfurimonas sp. CG23_combo_of_CG06-09_8_20_14_all_36_33]PIS24246.1 MAG: hypothetical protein COT46_10105 [Sulfurimonas sp. CG08_land_8_20_14_0_20_36_33]PIU36051.1 MAG: hypothetical protein COT05_00945 [Sulfurimonas sp. CG07_land_8_20_14_0_80_36_56]PIV04396.1 MAG: hypothetical protein COS56_0